MNVSIIIPLFKFDINGVSFFSKYLEAFKGNSYKSDALEKASWLYLIQNDTTNYIKSMRRIGVDSIVSKNISAVNDILNVIQSEKEEVIVSRFEDIDIDAIQLNCLPESRYFVKNYKVTDIPESICLAAIIRDKEIIIPSINTQIEPNEELLLFLKPESILKAENLFQ